MADAIQQGAYPPFTIALYGEREYCGPIASLFRSDERVSGAGVAYRRNPADFMQMVGRRRDIGAAVIVWSADDARGLADLVAGLRLRQVNPLMPILVRSITPLSAQTRSRLKENGLHGPYCRAGLDEATLVEDVLYAVQAMRERQALVALSAFANDRARLESLPELAAAALAFLHHHGIGDLGGLFCLFRPTSKPGWVVAAGTGRFGAAESSGVAGLERSVREKIESEDGGEGGRGDGESVLLRVVTPEGSRVSLYLMQKAPLTSWQQTLVAIFRDRLAIAVDEMMLRRRLERAHHANIATLASVAEYKDVDTGNHVTRVSRLAIEVARILADRGAGMCDDMLVQHIGHASILHDIGKVGIPERILLKAGPLDPDERSIMQGHAALGHEILLKAGMISERSALITLAAGVARSHHERYDGRGYPDGLAGEAIPLAARIVAVVDVFDALTGERPYKKPWPEEQAIDFVCTQAGFQFDPRVVEAFLAAVEGKKDDFAVTWSEAFSVGHEGIDQDHAKLFGILNRIWTARDVGDRQVVEMALDDLMHYSWNHFRREEAYMNSFGYPDVRAHCAAHESFSQRIDSLRWEYLHGLRREIHGELIEYLSRWLMGHILQADRMYSRYRAALAPTAAGIDLNQHPMQAEDRP